MRHSNKKIVSFVLAFAMILTMFSSMVVVRADATPEVYTELTETAEGINLKIAYRNFAEGTSLKSCSAYVKIPDGFTATKDDIELSDLAKSIGLKPNVTAANEIRLAGATTDPVPTGKEGTIATVVLTVPTDFDGEESIIATNFVVKTGEDVLMKLGNGVTAVAGKITTTGGGDNPPAGEVTLTLDKTAVSVAQGGTVTVGYEVDPADTVVTATCTDTANISNVNAADGVITITAQAAAAVGDYTVTVTAGDKTETITVTVTKTVTPGFANSGVSESTDPNKNNGDLKITVGGTAAEIADIKPTETYIVVVDGRNGDFLAGSVYVKVSGTVLNAIIDGTAEIQVNIPGAKAADTKVSVCDANRVPIEAK